MVPRIVEKCPQAPLPLLLLNLSQDYDLQRLGRSFVRVDLQRFANRHLRLVQISGAVRFFGPAQCQLQTRGSRFRLLDRFSKID